MKRFFNFTRRTALAISVIISLLISTFPVAAHALSGSDFQAGHIIDDSIFTNANSMSVQDIQNFLNAEVPTCDNWGTQSYDGTTRAAYSQANGQLLPMVCLKDYYENPTTLANNLTVTNGQTAPIPTGAISAAQIIYNAAQQYQINPQVILATIQKEQGLVTDSWPWDNEYKSATGYGCPDSTDICNSQYYGFYNQVTDAAWQFRAYMNSPNNYNYTVGDDYILYSPTTSCGGSTVTILNQATAALYDYTPYQPDGAALANVTGTGDSCSSYGNLNFWYYFNTWFGSSLNGTCIAGSTALDTDVAFQDVGNNVDLGTFLINSGAATGCVEAHVWNSGFQTWYSHTASNLPSINPADSKVYYADLNGDGEDVPILVDFANTGSGRVEFHIWNSGMQTWSSHIISNAPCINPAVSQIEFADLDGSGRDTAILIGDGAGSTSTGHIEFHVWSSDFQSFTQNIVSNSLTMNPAVSQIEFADLDGSGRDTAILIGDGAGSTSTGHIEFHVWSSDFQSFTQNIVSNSLTINPVVSEIQFADLDGSGTDSGILIGLHPPTGSGNIEFHVWNPGFQSWSANIASNQPTPAS